MVGDDLGQMRLVEVLDEAVFIAPKVYGGVISKTSAQICNQTEKGSFTKVKGFKGEIEYKDLKSLVEKEY